MEKSLTHGSSSADDLREAGWMVAAHDDHNDAFGFYTIWLFFKDDLSISGRGRTDAFALDIVRCIVEESNRLHIYKTSDGLPLTEEVIENLSKEAEKGYEASKLKPRSRNEK
jgi:hypothetical protein